jgi:transcriptional regulator with XRE-family HTH domain
VKNFPRTVSTGGFENWRKCRGAEVGRRDMEGVYMKRLLRKSRSRFNFFFKIRYWLRIGPKVRLATPIIGRYKRDEMKPSQETATKLAAALEVSLDYLVGIREMQVFDKSLLRRVEELANLPEQDRQGILFALDGLLRDAKARMAYQ